MHPTPYTDVNTALDLLLKAVQATVQGQLVGLYLYGSLASGDFDSQSSDIDFVVVTNGVLEDETIAELDAMHSCLLATGLKWMQKLEGSYIAQAAFRRYDPNDGTAWPTLNETHFYVAPHKTDWVIQRHIVREQGVVLAGPPPQTLIDPVSPDDLRQAVYEFLEAWWAPMIADPFRLESSGYQAYAILSMCRAWHTIKHGTIVSKPVAARWAQEQLGGPQKMMIEQALVWQEGVEMGRMQETLELIRQVVGHSREWRELSQTRRNE